MHPLKYVVGCSRLELKKSSDKFASKRIYAMMHFSTFECCKTIKTANFLLNYLKNYSKKNARNIMTIIINVESGNKYPNAGP